MKAKKVTEVLKTSDYDKFTILNGNRGINQMHVRNLRKSFQNSYLLCPILVNEKFEIIDGQHRFLAAKELNYPIFYIQVVDYGLEEVKTLNTNAINWQKEDYLAAYCDLGFEEYIKFRKFRNEFPEFGIRGCEVILTGRLKASSDSTLVELMSNTNPRGRYYRHYFENGELVIPDYDKSVENARKLMEVKKYYSGFNRYTFVCAMIGIFRINQYDHKTFIKRLAANQTLMFNCMTVTQYKYVIETIYNSKSHEKISLRF